MQSYTKRIVFWFVLAIHAYSRCLQLSADDRGAPKLAIKELEPRFADQEVTITLRVRGTGGISQRVKEGQTPMFSLEPEQEDDKKRLDVWIGGDLAEIVDRFGFGRGVPKIPSGATIQVTGRLQYSKRDSVEDYFMRVDDWKRFRILRYPTLKQENVLPNGPNGTKHR